MKLCDCGCGALVKRDYEVGHGRKGIEPWNKGKKYERFCYECGQNRIIKGRGRCSGCYKRMMTQGLPNDYDGHGNFGGFTTGQIPANKGSKLSESDKVYLSVLNTAEGNPRWKGGIDRNHKKYRGDWEDEAGRQLLKHEVLHHIDGNKFNNEFRNLRVFPSHSEHMKFHWKQQKARKQSGRMRKSGGV